MKLINIKCPNCGAPVKLEKTEGLGQCPFCKTAFYIDKEEKVPETVNINIEKYIAGDKNSTKNTKAINPRAMTILRILLIIFWLIFFYWLLSPHNDSATNAPKAPKKYSYLEIPKSEPFRDFVYKLYGKDADSVAKDEYAKLAYLMVGKAEHDDNSPWIFNYSYKIDSLGKPIDQQIITVDGANSVQIRDFQAFTGLVSAGYGENGDFKWDSEDYAAEINLKNLTGLKYFTSAGQSISEIKNAFADPSAIISLRCGAVGEVTTQDLEAFSNLKCLSISGRWGKNAEEEYWQLLSALKSLEELDLAFNFDSFSLNFLSSLTNLKKLDITNRDGDNPVDGLEVLYAMPKIETLRIEDVKQLKTLDFVKNMPLLHNLTIEDCNISDIEPLRDNLAITDLHIYGDSDSLNDLSALPTLKSLTNLYIDANGIDRGEMPHLSNLTNLRNLTIEALHTQSIKGLVGLEKLNLTGEATFGASDLSNLSGLKELSIRNMVVEGNIFQTIASFPQLNKLEITVNHSIDYYDCSPLFSSNSIEDLKFTTYYFSDDGYAYISMSSMPNNTKIKRFDMSSFSITNLDTGDYNSKPLGNYSNEFLSHLKGVEELIIRSNQIKDLNFVKEMPNLRVLDISDNYVTDIGILTSCPKLEKLICYENPIVNYTMLSENVEVIK